MSPSEAPESEEPYWATAAFSSAISSALIDTWILRDALSIWITLASTFSPTAKRSGRCSERSRARSLRLDEGGDIGAGDLDLDAVLLNLHHLAGDRVALLDALDLLHRVAGDLLDAERDALLLDVDVEHDSLDQVALLVVLDRFLARAAPVEVGKVDHAVDVALEADEQAEFGDVLDLALDLAAGRILLGEDHPGIVLGLLEAERDAALDRVDLEDLDGDLLGRGQDLARVDVLLGPAHLGDVDEALDAVLELDESAVIGDVGDPALDCGRRADIWRRRPPTDPSPAASCRAMMRWVSGLI